MLKKLKYHFIVFLILGFLLYVPQYLQSTNNIDYFFLIKNIFTNYLMYSSITILVGLLTFLISKNLDKTIKYTKITLNVTIVFMIILLQGNIYIYFKYL